MTTPTPLQILIIVMVVIGLMVAMRLIQPKLSPSEKYLLHIIQHKSPQMDNIYLFMWIKMVIHPVETLDDLEYQRTYLEDSQQFKMLSEQMYGFGAFALFPFFGFEAANWKMDPSIENPLMLRLAAVDVIRRYPHTAEVIEEFLIHSPDTASTEYFNKNQKIFRPAVDYRARYAYNLYRILSIIINTSRNEWWPGTSPDVREWAESIFNRLPKSFTGMDFSILNFGSISPINKKTPDESGTNQ